MSDSVTVSSEDIVLLNAPYPMYCVRRATFRKRINYYNSDTVLSNVYLSGLFEIKTHASSPVPLLSGTHLNKILLFAPSKSLDIVIPSAITKGFEFQKAYYHLFVTNSQTGYTRRLLHGPFYCEQT